MKFIKLSTERGHKFTVNPVQITTMNEGGSCTHVYFSDGKKLEVKQTIKAIEKLAKEVSK